MSIKVKAKRTIVKCSAHRAESRKGGEWREMRALEWVGLAKGCTKGAVKRKKKEKLHNFIKDRRVKRAQLWLFVYCSVCLKLRCVVTNYGSFCVTSANMTRSAQNWVQELPKLLFSLTLPHSTTHYMPVCKPFTCNNPGPHLTWHNAYHTSRHHTEHAKLNTEPS